PGSELGVVWRLTEHCDLGCSFCTYSRRLRRPRLSADPVQVLAFGALLKDYAATFRRDVLVSWLGGEPLRWPQLFEISPAFKREFNLRLGVTTNGTALKSESVRRHLVEDFDQLTISIDGLGAFHDRGRDAPGLFEQLRLNILSLREMKISAGRGPLLRVNTILMRDNIGAFEQLCETVAAWGIEELTFNALGGRDRPEFFPEHSLRLEDVEWFRESLPGIRARLREKGLRLLGSARYLERIAASARGISIPVYDCQPGQSFLFVNERGLVSPCGFTTQGYGLSLKDICAPDDLHQLPVRFAERKRNQMLACCHDCPSTQVFGKFEGTAPNFNR
ncbi:MAG: radical SAM protein, partial [Chloroflexota bacterium]